MPSNEEQANSGNSLFGKCGIPKSKVKKRDLFHVCNVKDVLTCLSCRLYFPQCFVLFLNSVDKKKQQNRQKLLTYAINITKHVSNKTTLIMILM